MFRPSNPNDKYLTAAEEQEWQRQRDEKKEDFPFIHLSNSEKMLLMQCSADWVRVTNKNRNDAIRLQDLDLIRKQRSDSPGKENEEICEIRDRGRNYLKYLEGEDEKEHRQFSHDWKIAMFSALAGALLSKPIWGGIDCAWSFIKPALAQLLQLLLQSQ